MTKLLIAYGADVNAKGMLTSGTPLHYAAEHDDPEVVTMLLDAGADMSATKIGDETPYEVAKKHNNQRVLAVLAAWAQRKVTTSQA
jgi:ankyrin repeat protein